MGSLTLPRPALPALCLFGALALAGCAADPPASTAGGRGECVDDFVPGTDYFPEKSELRHAENFSVSYHGHYKVLRTRMPATNWGPQVDDVAVLVRCGTPAPELSGELAGATVIEIPVRRFGTNSLASAVRLRLLGLDDRIRALPAGPWDDLLAARLESGDAVEVGAHGDPALERLVAQGIEALVTFSSSLEHISGIERARELGVGALPLLSWAEPTYLGQAEWVKHHALLFDAEAEAEAFFSEVERRYRLLAGLVRDREAVPTLWATPTSPGRWWVEAGNWQDEVLAAAGGRNVFVAAADESSIVLSSERLVEAGGSVAVWITGEPDPEVLTESLPIDEIAAWGSGRTWHLHRRTKPERGAFDWNETPLVRPDLVLEDLIAVLHPDVLPGHTPTFLAPVRPDSR